MKCVYHEKSEEHVRAIQRGGGHPGGGGYHPQLLPLTMRLREKAGLPKAAIYTLGLGTGAPSSPGELESLLSPHLPKKSLSHCRLNEREGR